MKGAPGLNHVFVYGTLLRGECNHHWISPYTSNVRQGMVRGILVDLGPYPALVPGKGEVRGEIVTLREREQAYLRLDELEDYKGSGHPDNEYEKIVMKAKTAEGQSLFCSVYVMTRRKLATMGYRRILPSGDWRWRTANGSDSGGHFGTGRGDKTHIWP